MFKNTGGEVGAGYGYALNYQKMTNVFISGRLDAAGTVIRLGGVLGQIYLSGSHQKTENVSSSVVVNASSSNYVGGWVGRARQLTDIDSSYATGDVTGNTQVGGFVGILEFGSINNTYSSGDVSGSSIVGGHVGNAASGTVIDNSYSRGAVSGSTAVGGFAGNSSGTISNSYYDTDTSGQGSAFGDGSGDVTGKTTSQMQQNATYINWDFTNIWRINEGNAYPELIFQPVDNDADGVPDSEDTLIGGESDVTSSGVSSLEFYIEGQTNGGLSATYTGTKSITFNDTGSPLISFTHDFSEKTIDLSSVSIVKTNNQFLVRGLELSTNENKTIYVNFNSDSICVTDAEVTSVNDKTPGCNGVN